MLYNADEDSNNYSEIELFDFCVIGGGPAGITTALNLSKNSTVFLAEGGSLELNEISQKNYNHGFTENYYKSSDNYRLRFFGGYSNHWGGNNYLYSQRIYQ